LRIGNVKRYPIILIDLSVNAEVVGFRGWTGVKFNFIFENSLTSPLLADSEGNLGIGINSFNRSGDSLEFLQGHAIPFLGVSSFNFSGNGLFVEQFDKLSIPTDTIAKTQISIVPETSLGSLEIGIFKDNTKPFSIFKDNFPQIRSGEVSSAERGIAEVSSIQNGIGEVTKINSSSREVNVGEVSSSKNATIQGIVSTQEGVEVLGQHFFIPNTTQIQPTQIQSTEVSLPSLVSSQQLFSGNVSHDNTPLLTRIYSTAQSIWHSSTDLNLNFTITNLPTGQLAEATITGYDNLGRPNTATISIDDDANGIGWFLDTTPQDNSEFTGTYTYFQATPNSAASGKYDLLTTILHEMGHTLGIINGYSEFDKYVKGRQFITNTFTANLTPDGSHLDTTFHPYDLMNTSLKPGVRKLPSALNLAMINAINAGIGNGMSGVGTVNPAHLTAGALIGITNGDFTTPTTWNTAGATNIINGTATLTEQSQKLSELTQAFIIPTGAKTLQFTIKDNHLIPGDTTKTANDAFEVALLDTNTFTPLAGTSIGLNHTDSLLNIQANGTIHKSDKVTITALSNNSSIVTIDLTQVTPSTQATLYFNLLGFGARTSTVTIDDVKLFTDTQPIPVTKNDTLTLDPTQLTTNDTNVTQIQIINQPTHGTLTQTPDGKLTYTPVPTYVGNDSFTYLGFGTDGQLSNLATVNLTVNNLPPTIETLTIPAKINEGQNIQLSATAKDGVSWWGRWVFSYGRRSANEAQPNLQFYG
jgi:Bacterial Ig domain